MTETELIESWPKTYTYAGWEFDLTIAYNKWAEGGYWTVLYSDGDGWCEGPDISAPTLKEAILELDKLIKND